eukprot:CAMPEP_0206146620 /NCGR_PEP_ID=MMETSP1473-20131121/30908_1 /ASSEMBLY_ACC=CAM_ASM_001109 /TAXON_ID=1461547 /ORGANISM="Stichococcus sp, Strain RCC1054" /LENGTH=555 /DNA_ID=CAMNT_0053543239 /DNA_START=120 /DNA_END=1787 /DNA_ORIENTATION=-
MKPDGHGGHALFSSRPFARGELVLHEHAFLVYDPHSQRARQWVAQAKRSPAARAVRDPELRAMLCHSMAFQLLYAQATREVQEKVQSLYCHEVGGDAGPGDQAVYATQALTAARAVRCPSSGAAFQPCRSHDEMALARVPMVFNTNSFGIGPGHDSYGLLHLAARFNHACGLRCLARLKEGDSVKFVATRDIAAGELLSHDYHDSHAMAPTPLRRLHLLEDKFFHCTCDLCTLQVDRFRALPCPRCAVRTADGTLEPFAACWGTRASGRGNISALMSASGNDRATSAVVTCDMALVTAGTSPWSCEGCGGAFPDSIPLLLAPVWGALGNLATDPAGPEVALERQLAAAQETVAAVQAAGKALDPDASLFHTVAALHVTSCTCLGPAHWCSWRAKQLLLGSRRLQLRGFLASAARRPAHAEEVAEAAYWLSELRLLADAVFSWAWDRSPPQAFGQAAQPALDAATCLLDAAACPTLDVKHRAEAAAGARTIVAAVGQARAAHSYMPAPREVLEALLAAVARAPAASLQLPPEPQLAALAPGSATAAALAAQLKVTV